MDDTERYRSGNWGNWNSTTENDIPDHEAVENLLRRRSVEGTLLDRTDMDDTEWYRSGDRGNWKSTTENDIPDHEAVENLLRRRSVEGNGPDSYKEDDDMNMGSEDEEVPTLEKGKQKMVRVI